MSLKEAVETYACETKLLPANKKIVDVEPELWRMMENAVKTDSMTRARYLLELGYNGASWSSYNLPRPYATELPADIFLLYAYSGNQHSLAKLLQEYGVKLRSEADNGIDVATLAAVRHWLGPIDKSHSIPCTTYQQMHYVNTNKLCDSEKCHVVTSWPPTPSMSAPAALKCRWNRQHIEKYIECIAEVRRVEARFMSFKNWSILRDWVRQRAIMVYWQEQTLVRTCACGGVMRERDLVSFKTEFTSSVL